MSKPIARDAIYRKRVFDADIIELCVRRYITHRLSYRDPVEMMAGRGIKVAHTTVLRWATRYVPQFEKRWRRFSTAVGTSWRVDQTYISINAKWNYLYRAVDQHGKTVDFLLRRDRGIAAAQAFCRKALASTLPRFPRKVTLDGHVPSRRALRRLRREHPCWRNVTVRTSKYLNNLIEQDHRAIKRRCASMAGFKSLDAAARDVKAWLRRLAADGACMFAAVSSQWPRAKSLVTRTDMIGRIRHGKRHQVAVRDRGNCAFFRLRHPHRAGAALSLPPFRHGPGHVYRRCAGYA